MYFVEKLLLIPKTKCFRVERSKSGISSRSPKRRSVVLRIVIWRRQGSCKTENLFQIYFKQCFLLNSIFSEEIEWDLDQKISRLGPKHAFFRLRKKTPFFRRSTSALSSDRIKINLLFKHNNKIYYTILNRNVVTTDPGAPRGPSNALPSNFDGSFSFRIRATACCPYPQVTLFWDFTFLKKKAISSNYFNFPGRISQGRKKS